MHRHRRFLLTTHVRPDADGLGSMLGLAEVLRRQGKEVRLLIASAWPPRYDFLDPENRSIAESTGLTVWLKVSFANVGDRVKIDGTRPKFTSKEQAEKLYLSRDSYYSLAQLHVSTDNGTPETIADEVVEAIRKS